jgi:Na+-transporting NADH:ubiquinone oxidoreductase subunit B
MSFLHKQLKKVEPLFEEGGKYERLYPLYEAGASFLYTSGKPTESGAHVRDAIDLKRTMIMVVIALIPCILMACVNTGYQALLADSSSGVTADTPWSMGLIGQAGWIGLLAFLPIYVVTLAAGGAIEAAFSIVRKHEINEGFLVTSMLFPLTLPPDIPLWQVALGIAFGTLIGKEIFGGTGMNILNPALTGRLFLYIAYPAQISGEVWTVMPSDPALLVDGYSGATALATFYSASVAGVADATAGMDWWAWFVGWVPGSMGETSVLACLIGAAVLIGAGIGSWRIMLSCLLGLIAMTLLLNATGANAYTAVPWHWHLVTGGFAFGMVFMATDPVSAAQTDTGRWIYGFLIGALTVIVRVLNPAYPEGIMLAIIFMNVFAPAIDYFVVKANVKRREKRLGLQ